MKLDHEAYLASIQCLTSTMSTEIEKLAKCSHQNAMYLSIDMAEKIEKRNSDEW